MDDETPRRRLLFRPFNLLLLVVLAALVPIVPEVISRLPELDQREEFLVSTGEIVLTPPGKWVPDDLARQVAEESGLPERLSLLDDDLTRDLAEAFTGHPWVHRVEEVRKSRAGIEIDLEYRSPVAMVEVSDGMYPVTADGILLPPGDFTAKDVKAFPVVRNAGSRPQGPAGMPWGDMTVAAGAKLAEVLGPHWKAFDLAAILLPPESGRHVMIDDLVLQIQTAGGSRIIWGRVPGSDAPGELTTEQKIGRLKKYLADFGAFEKPSGPSVIDIRLWKGISRRPHSAAPRRNRLR